MLPAGLLIRRHMPGGVVLQWTAELLAQPLWATHVRIAALVKAQPSIHVARQTDAYTRADGARLPPARRKPERAGGAQIKSILPEINLHRLG
jgi:hypothetical protein